MLRRAVAAGWLLLVLGGLALAETYQGSIVELTDSKLTLLALKRGPKRAQKEVLAVGDKVTVAQPRGKGEKQLTLAELQKRVARAQKNARLKGVRAAVTTDGGRVVSIKLDPSKVPEKAAAILGGAEAIELYSLEPDEQAAKNWKGNTFRGWPVLGKTALKDAKQRQQVLDALDEAVGTGAMAKCFDPRHGIRATHGGKTVDLVLCFECGQVYVYFDPKKSEHTTLSLARGTQPELDSLLKAAGVPLAKPKK
jgi:hypothetical protein